MDNLVAWLNSKNNTDRIVQIYMQGEVIEEIAKHLGVSPQDIDVNANLTENLGLGPVELADLLQALSQRFKVTIEEEEVGNLQTVNDIVVLIEDLSLEE